MRVYEIAKEVGIPNKDLIAKIRALGLEVNNHMSSLDADDVARIKRSLEKEKQAVAQPQQTQKLSTGTVLRSNQGRAMLRIVRDTCGRHDTLGGACSAESNTVRYSLEKRYMHSCRDSFLLALARRDAGMSKRDLPSNINFFMNVPVTPAGGLTFADGISAAGRLVEMEALMDVLVLISNCPQLNNPCNAYNPTPVRVQSWKSA